MKKAKIFVSLMLTLVMVLAMAIPAFAATETTGKITVDNATVGQTYTVYKILNLESYNIANEAYLYKPATTDWETFINSTGIKDVYVTIDAEGYVKPVADADFAEFAKLAKKYAADHTIQNQGSKEATSTDTTATTTTVEFTGLELGYYLVDSSIGSLCSLDTTNKEVTIHEKNAEPTVAKKIKLSETELVDKNTVNIGDTVNYKTTITVKAGAENYVLHDIMDAGLTLDSSTIKVTVDGADVTESATTYAKKVKGTANVPADADCTFEIVFANDYLKELAKDLTKEADNTKEIVVTYSATLNENAVIGDAGNKNKTYLKYGDDNKTTEPETITRTWNFNVFKYAEINNTETPLSGATFTLSRNDDGSNPISLVKVTDGSTADPKTADVYRPAIGTETGVTEIVTNATGKFTIQGLDSDTYYLKETKAPEGYNLPATPTTTVVISEEGKINATDTEPDGIADKTIKILNQAGPELPSTGGIGTTIFYIVGGILLVGAGVVLVVRRRMRAEAKSK